MNDRYAVRYVCNDTLPEGIDWVFVTIDGALTLCIKHGAVTPRTLADAWAAYRVIQGPQPSLIPHRPLTGPVAPAFLWVGVAALLVLAGTAVVRGELHVANFWGNVACALSAFAAVAHIRWRGTEAMEQTTAVAHDELATRRQWRDAS